jgi:magnesium-transporting ATPase (P-type)
VSSMFALTARGSSEFAAFRRILKLQNFDPNVVKQYRSTAQEFATRGFRSLGVAAKEEGQHWELLGIMAMFDPPRSDTAAVSWYLAIWRVHNVNGHL